MPPQDYRYYRLDSAGHIHMAESFRAASDDDAIAQIDAKHPDGTCEIWHGKRLIAKLSHRRFHPDDEQVQNAVAERLSQWARRMAK